MAVWTGALVELWVRGPGLMRALDILNLGTRWSGAMRGKRITAYAKAVVTVEVTGLGSWGPDCQNDQVFRQASEAAIGRLQNCKDLSNVRIIGEPKITMICAQEE
jgi:hypothetical protein